MAVSSLQQCCSAPRFGPLLLLSVLIAQLVATVLAGKPVPLVLPLSDSKYALAVQAEGLEVLQALKGPLSPVVVIGPYRSGKSFLLNQLLGVPCDTGFGVGHTRDTQTKGIWMWSEAQQKDLPDGSSLQMIFIDTEGFESTTKANSYDDRIFALSTLLSSLLIYNLPETIRQSDISKLSFAVELAQGFYERYQDGASTSATGASSSLDPGGMIWVIQRDFLQGKSANELLTESLKPVPNPNHDKEVDQLNAIRESLAAIAGNSTGVSLRQPHLDRTKLCELADSELDPVYLQQRDALKELVLRLARPKVVAGVTYSGQQLAALLRQTVDALNSQEIPNVGSIVDAFNRDVIGKAVKGYVTALQKVQLPADEETLAAAEATAKAIALKAFSATSIGRKKGEGLQASLLTQLQREADVRATQNQAASAHLCSSLEAACEGELDELQNMRLPSLRKFEARFSRCKQRFLDGCMGPAKSEHLIRLDKAWSRAKGHFDKEYNGRLYSGLIGMSMAGIVLFRFVFRVQILEALVWCCLLFLWVTPYIWIGQISLYETAAWRWTVRVWEALMMLLFGFDLAPVLWVGALIGLIVWRLHRSRQQRQRRKRQATMSRDLDV